MTAEYALYLESGPRMKTTMVHVLDLLGCIANGPTTDAALQATPGEIREYLGFLQRHGEQVDPDVPFATHIAAHVMEGSWIGYGDPEPGFAPDFEPLFEKDETEYRARFRWLGEDICELVRAAPSTQLAAKPGWARAIREIVAHIAGAEPEYFRASNIGKPDGTKEALQAIESAPGDERIDRLADLWRLLDGQLAGITDEIRNGRVQRGGKLWTARRGFRRALEHPWEHLREMQRRLTDTPA